MGVFAPRTLSDSLTKVLFPSSCLRHIPFARYIVKYLNMQTKSNVSTVEIGQCRVINFPKIVEARGNLSFIEENNQVPFPIKRIYYLYDVPSGATRGGHAHRTLSELIIALSGSFDVVLDDGKEKRVVFLNRPHYGLLIPPGFWREIENFSSNSVALVFASDFYNEKDYIRDYEVFKKMVANDEL